ncbi:MAG TPA: M28 family peptidase [Pyrinomonadaceae bacterium]|nr:M28 family peptidase [Pyrinomonadaceae bacterium]
MTNFPQPGRRKFLSALLMLAGCAQALTPARGVVVTTPAAPSRATPDAFKDTALVVRYQQSITPEELAARVYFLASDFFEGRETGTRGQKLAAHYLASQYRRAGLKPAGNARPPDPLAPEAFFQKFRLYRRTPREARLEVSAGGRPAAPSVFNAEAQDDLSYFGFGELRDVAAAGVVFAGHGISDKELGYDDFAALAEKGIELDGKWLVLLADEPLKDASTSLLRTPDGKPSKWTAQIVNKRLAVWRAGRPAGVLVVADAGPRSQGTFAEGARRAGLAARRLGPLTLHRTSPSGFPPTYFISTKLADRILAPAGQSVAAAAREIGRAVKPLVFEVPGVTVSSSVRASEAVETENVLAFVEGTDPKLRDEVVVVSSHYDHLGQDPQLEGDQIYNGAADDASGTVAALALAEAFARARREGHGPRRSLLFANFSGEEKGLLGSSHYADAEPAVPLARTVANINMDGVAGFDPKHPAGSRDYVYVVGSPEVSAELRETNRRLNELTGTKLRLDDVRYFASDQYNFEKYFVPFIYFSTGLTEHYHRPSDEAHTISYEHMARVVRLAFANAWQVANQDAPPAGVDRGRLVQEGYVCRPCPFECDALLAFDAPGDCPACGMSLEPKLVLK